jgi:zinc protease
MHNPITRLTLSNGLLVLLKEIHTAPLVSHWVWYRVGSRDEVPGITGISHWVEHMQFKGTAKYPGGVLDKAIARDGGYWNAYTNLDWTVYFETMPSDKIDLALSLEADRMVASLFDPDEVAAERTVIISERQGNENEPLFRLNEEIQAVSFRVHSYHHEIIGDLPDLHAIQRDDLYAHYRTYYVPNNAIVTIAGDFETDKMLERLRQLYEPLPAGSAPPRRLRPEPPQTGERSVTVEGPGETTYVQIAHHVVEASHPDFFPLVVMDSLLSGPSGLSLSGGGISNKTSRLYRALVENELAVSVHGGLHATLDPFLHEISIVVHPGRAPAEVIERVEEEIHALREVSPQPGELQRAVKQARALFAYGSESITNQAFWLGFAEMHATYEWFLNYLASLDAVRPEDVQRVAQSYLRPQNRVVGVYLPDGDGGRVV